MRSQSGMLTRSLEGAREKVETSYYDIRKQVFELHEVMNNTALPVYAETPPLFGGPGAESCKVIGYGAHHGRTSSSLRQPRHCLGGVDLAGCVSKVAGISLSAAISRRSSCRALSMRGAQGLSSREQLRNAYEPQGKQVIQSPFPTLMRQGERSFILQQIRHPLREHLRPWTHLRDRWAARLRQKDPTDRNTRTRYDMFLEHDDSMRRNVLYSMFMFQPHGKTAAVATG